MAGPPRWAHTPNRKIRGAEPDTLADVTNALTGLYARQSLDRKRTELAVSRQLAASREYSDRSGWTDRREYVDNDLSATKGPRPDYDRLMADVRGGLVDRIVVFHLARLWRNRRERAEGIEILQLHRVMLACVKGPTIDFSTAYGRGMAAMLGEVDTMEVEIKSERQILANEQAAVAGLPHRGGPRPFGYAQGGTELVPAEADAVRAAYDHVIGGGSLRGIAKTWNEAGLTTGKPRWGKHAGEPSRWTSPGVGEVLRNPRYAGLRVYRGTEYPAKWPALVSDQTYRTVVAILADPTRRPVATFGVALLTTVATCGVCGATVHSGGGGRRGKAAPTGEKRYRVYRCSENSGKHIARRADHIDNLVTTLVLEYVQRPDAVELIRRREEEVDMPALVAERETIRRRRKQLAEEFADDDTMPVDALRSATEKLNRRFNAVGAALAEAAKVSALVPLVTADDADEAWAVWEEMDIDAKRTVIDELMTVRLMSVGRGARTFRPESVQIEWKV